MVIDKEFGRSYNMTRAAALLIVNRADPPLKPAHLPAGSPAPVLLCFWCGKEGGHFHDCALFVAIRVVQLTEGHASF